MIIRSFKSSDTPFLVQIFYNSVHSIASRYYSPEAIAAWAPPISEYNLEQKHTKFASNITLIAEIEDTIVGFADMTQEGYLDHIYVDPKFQAQGVAYNLFKQIETIAKQKNLTTITTHASVMAMPLAKRMGFKIVNKETIIYRGVSMIRYHMEKELL